MPRGGDAKPKPLSATFDAAIDSPAWLPDGSGLPVLADREGRAGLWRILLDGTTIQVADSLASDLKAYGGGQAFSKSRGGALAMTRGSPTSPGDAWFTTAAGVLTKKLTAVNDDVFADRQVGQVTSFWSSSSTDGQRFHSWIVTPPGYSPGKTYPMIPEIHGGPFAAYGDRFDIEKQWMAAQGYVVRYVNPQGSTSSGEAFARLIDKTYPSDDSAAAAANGAHADWYRYQMQSAVRRYATPFRLCPGALNAAGAAIANPSESDTRPTLCRIALTTGVLRREFLPWRC